MEEVYYEDYERKIAQRIQIAYSDVGYWTCSVRRPPVAGLLQPFDRCVAISLTAVLGCKKKQIGKTASRFQLSRRDIRVRPDLTHR